MKKVFTICFSTLCVLSLIQVNAQNTSNSLNILLSYGHIGTSSLDLNNDLTINLIDFAKSLLTPPTPTYTPNPTPPGNISSCPNMSLRRATASENPHFFYNSCNQPVYLVGSHTWSGPQDYVSAANFKKWDLNQFISMLTSHHHNYARGWVWDSPQADNGNFGVDHYKATPELWERTGPGTATDGGLKFDLTKVNPAYLSELRATVATYRSANIYFSVMFFNGWSTYDHLDGRQVWKYHPFNLTNNINGLNITPDASHTANSDAWIYQKNYINAVVHAVDGYDNVFYEISNEDNFNTAWENQIISYVKSIPDINHKIIGQQFSSNSSLADWWSVDQTQLDLSANRPVFEDTDHIGTAVSYPDAVQNAHSRQHYFALMEAWNNNDTGRPNTEAVSTWYDNATVESMRKLMCNLRKSFENASFSCPTGGYQGP